MIRPARRALAASTIALLAGGCQALVGFEDFGGASASPHPCDALPSATKLDALGKTLLVLTKSGKSCFWLQEHEVTVAEYDDWVGLPSRPPFDAVRCGWKTGPSNPAADPADTCRSQIGSRDHAPFQKARAMRCVDWCDANAYCGWLGGALCSTLPMSVGSMDPGGPDQVTPACGGLQSLPYPYGATLDPLECQLGEDPDTCGVTPGSSCGPADDVDRARCVSPNGALDMLGNVAEWALNCTKTPVTAQEALCLRRGGSFADDPALVNCNPSTLKTARRDARDPYTGIRCCFGLSADEQEKVKAASATGS